MNERYRRARSRDMIGRTRRSQWTNRRADRRTLGRRTWSKVYKLKINDSRVFCHLIFIDTRNCRAPDTPWRYSLTEHGPLRGEEPGRTFYNLGSLQSIVPAINNLLTTNLKDQCSAAGLVSGSRRIILLVRRSSVIYVARCSRRRIAPRILRDYLRVLSLADLSLLYRQLRPC